MPMTGFRLPWLASLFMLVAMGPRAALAQAPALPDAKSVAVAAIAASVTREQLNTRIEQVTAITELDAATKGQLLEQYRKALGFLDAAKTSNDARDAFQRSTTEAPLEAKKIKDELARTKDVAPAAPKISPTTPLTELEQRLQKQKADLAAVEARLADIQKGLADAETRPAAIRQRLTEARRQMDDLAEARKAAPATGELPVATEARRWAAEAQSAALSAEVRMLEEELVSQPMRVELLKAQSDQAARQAEALRTGLLAFEEQVSDRRRAEAEAAKVEAKAAERAAVGRHPLMQQLAEQNADLSDELAKLTAELEQATAQQKATEREAKRVEEDFRSAKKKLEVAGLSQALGRVLLEQKRSLPEARVFQRKAEALEEPIGEGGLRQIHLAEEHRALLELDAYVDGWLAKIPAAEQGSLRGELEKLAANRRDLIEKAQATQDSYLRTLGELDFLYRRVAESIGAYRGFLDERLLWIRSAKPVQLATLGTLPEEVKEIFVTREWLEVARALPRGLTASPILILALAAVVALIALGPRIRRKLVETGKSVGRLSTDHFSLTLQALGWTVLLALRWPAVVALAGAALQSDAAALFVPILTAVQDESSRMAAFQPGVSLVRSVAYALERMSIPLFFLWSFHLLCLPKGLGEAHFRWSQQTLQLICRETRRLIVTLVPAGFVAIIMIGRESPQQATTLGLLAFLVITISLAVFFWRVLHPRTGALREFLADHPTSLIARLRYAWYPLIVALPMSLTVLALAGYLYTAGTVTGAVIQTMYLVMGLIVVRELVVRWLVLVERRLRLKALRERRAAQRAAAAEPPREEGTLQIEEREVDIVALSEQSTRLLNTGLLLTGLFGAWGIWSGILPAFGIFEEITLWHYATTIDGEEKRVAITLGDVVLSLILVFVTTVAARRLPALIEILLLQRLEVSSANRFTVTTLARYVIVIIGTVLVFNTLGGSWAQIQWLVAALGVGIGFGLQEIVANFISGLIILFERPLRVGDAVTVGDVEGVVSKIQIRATTITTWDRRELLVPNKEFITGRLLNWSLSDPITRIQVPVGVDYGADVKLAMKLMAEAAERHEHVLADPKPAVIFQSFGDNSLLLSLRCFVPSIDYRLTTMSELHDTINDKFRDAKIGIAFPQRDVHLFTSQPLDVRIARTGEAS